MRGVVNAHEGSHIAVVMAVSHPSVVQTVPALEAGITDSIDADEAACKVYAAALRTSTCKPCMKSLVLSSDAVSSQARNSCSVC